MAASDWSKVAKKGQVDVSDFTPSIFLLKLWLYVGICECFGSGYIGYLCSYPGWNVQPI